MKRAVAHTVLYLCCLGSSIATCTGTELNSSWKPLGQAKINKKSRPVVPFRPELTLEENNRILSQHRSKALIVNVTVPVNKMSSLHLVNQAVRWEAGGRSLSGRVTAVMLSEDQKNVTVFAEISDPQMSQPDRSISDAGLLSVEG